MNNNQNNKINARENNKSHSLSEKIDYKLAVTRKTLIVFLFAQAKFCVPLLVYLLIM